MSEKYEQIKNNNKTEYEHHHLSIKLMYSTNYKTSCDVLRF